jgi:hypothetical protein
VEQYTNTKVKKPTMTQTEIFQNMTKGGLKQVPSGRQARFAMSDTRYLTDGKYITIQVVVNSTDVSRSKEADEITNRIAALINKGITPEGVGKMKTVLEHLLTLEAFKKRFPFLATLSEEALTAAKL